MLGAPIAIQAAGNLFIAGMNPGVFHRRQRVRVALTGHDSAQDGLATGAHHVGDHVGQLDIHLHQRLLHVLYTARLRAQQGVALSGQGPQYAYPLVRAEGPTQQPVAHQLLQPLEVQHIALAARDMQG